MAILDRYVGEYRSAAGTIVTAACEAAGNYVKIHTRTGRYMVREPLKQPTPATVRGTAHPDDWSRTYTRDGGGIPVITAVDSATSAAAAGLLAGDSVIVIDGRDPSKLSTWFEAEPGAEVKLRIRRAGAERDVVLTAGQLKSAAPTGSEQNALRCVMLPARASHRGKGFLDAGAREWRYPGTSAV